MSEETELIKERLDIGDLVGEYVTLKQAGRHLKGLCPFHSEKTPSFVVSPDKGIYHCFGCGEGGDIFAFLQRKEGIEFPAALEQLAERTGVTLPKRRSGAKDPRARIFEILDLTAKLYHEILTNQSPGKRALKYLQERGVNAKTVGDFQLGYAPQQWDTAIKFLESKGYTEAELERSGLIGRSERGKLYDRFRGRIMFPIHDVQGRVIAFGGRIAPWTETGNEGKYINSPETSVYAKRRVVYNLNRAKQVLRKTEPCVVVEGYLDVVMLAQAGHKNVVASSGTAFTGDQVALLSRYTSTLHFAFDSDGAGVAAAEAATHEAIAAGMRVATVVFPLGQDPADVAKGDPKALATYLEQPVPLVNLLLDRLQGTDIGDRDQLLERLLPLIKRVTNVVHQGEMIQQVATTLHVPESVIVSQLATVAVTEVAPAASAQTGSFLPENEGYRILLGLLVLEPAARQQIMKQVQPEDLPTGDAQALYEQLAIVAKKHKDFPHASADQLLTYVPDSFMPQAQALRLVAEEYVERLEEYRQGAKALKQEAERLWRGLQIVNLEQQLQVLQEQLGGASAKEQAALLSQFQETMESLNEARSGLDELSKVLIRSR